MGKFDFRVKLDKLMTLLGTLECFHNYYIEENFFEFLLANTDSSIIIKLTSQLIMNHILQLIKLNI